MSKLKQDITVFTLWSQTLENIKKGFKDSFLVTFLLLGLPSFVFTLFLRTYSHTSVSFIKETTDKMLASQGTTNYYPLYEAMTKFATSYMLVIIFLFVLLVVSFAALNLIALEKLGHYEGYQGNFPQLLKKALRLAFPKAFVILLVTFLLSSERALLGPIRVFSLLGFAALSIVITEKKGAFSSLWQAITLKFVTNKKGVGFRVFWMVFSTGALLYLYEYFMSIIIEGLQKLSSQSLFLESFLFYQPSFLPCSLWKLTLDSLHFISYLFLFIFMINFISCLYVLAARQLTEKK